MKDNLVNKLALKAILEEFGITPRQAAAILELSENYVRNACSTGATLSDEKLKHLVDVLSFSNGIYGDAPRVIGVEYQKPFRSRERGVLVVKCPYCGRPHFHGSASLNGAKGEQIDAGCTYRLHPDAYKGYLVFPVGDLSAVPHYEAKRRHMLDKLKDEEFGWAKDSAL